MLCSTVIPTIGRPSLTKAVTSVLEQSAGRRDFEIIVVNDSGAALGRDVCPLSDRVSVVHTNQRNRSVARNAGAALAKGKFLHFLDDDDWMLPGAFQCLADLAESTAAGWLYGAFRLVDNAGASIVDIRPTERDNCSIQLLAWEWVPLQASWISSDAFFAVGGFAPLPSLLGGFEDVHLSRRISLEHDFACTESLVTAIRTGEAGSTTNYVDMFGQNRQSREKILNIPLAHRRLRASADASGPQPGYWHGKLVYYYLASTKWNLRRREIATAASRLGHAAACSLLAWPHQFSTGFWRGLTMPHYPRMGEALQRTGADSLYSETRRQIRLLEKI